jgi:hypothetical protein
MLHLVNALVAVLVVTGALAVASLRPRTALLLGSTGSVIAEFVMWVAAPAAWSHPLAPWTCALLGTVTAVAVWSLVRATPWLTDLVGSDS